MTTLTIIIIYYFIIHQPSLIFSSLRVELFFSVIFYHPSFPLLIVTEQFIYLLECKIPYIERTLANFILKSFKLPP